MDYAQQPLNDLLNLLQGYQGTNLGQVPLALRTETLRKIDGDLRLIDLLDIGGEAFVFAAADPAGRKVVAKVALPKLVTNKPAPQKSQVIFKLWKSRALTNTNINVERERFKEGIKIQVQLSRLLTKVPSSDFYIPTVHYQKDIPCLYYVMEFIEGKKIVRWLKEKADIVYSLTQFCKLLAGVQFIHQYGIVHRDLKSDNIFITDHDRIGILDWTLAKEIGRNLTIVGVPTPMGSLPYASPKILANQHGWEATYPDDIFALGFILIEFLTFEKLQEPKEFDLYNIDDLQLFIDQCRGMIPETFHKIFNKATALIEEDRYQDVGTFLHDIRAKLDEIKSQMDTQRHSDNGRTQRVHIPIIVARPDVPDDLCADCSFNSQLCLKYKLCNKVMAAMKALKQEGWI